MKITKEILLARDIIRRSDFVLITAGAGMGVDSGLPDFRGSTGFWRAYPPLAKLGLSFPQVSNPQWFHRDPHFAWGFFGHRYHLYSNTVPHPGFGILKNWVQNKEHLVFTSNVDGHFSKAGFDDDKIVECHGSIHFLQCVDTYKCSIEIWPMGKEKLDVDLGTFRAEEPLPKCKNCGGLARPNILMFGDHAWVSDRTDAQFSRLEDKIAEKMWKMCVIEIGAGEAVQTVRGFGNKMVQRHKAEMIRINPDSSMFGKEMGVHVRMGALDALNAIQSVMNE